MFLKLSIIFSLIFSVFFGSWNTYQLSMNKACIINGSKLIQISNGKSMIINCSLNLNNMVLQNVIWDGVSWTTFEMESLADIKEVNFQYNDQEEACIGWIGYDASNNYIIKGSIWKEGSWTTTQLSSIFYAENLIIKQNSLGKCIFVWHESDIDNSCYLKTAFWDNSSWNIDILDHSNHISIDNIEVELNEADQIILKWIAIDANQDRTIKAAIYY
jgi:hypothetical protein